jgi:hypothetical protein
MGKKINAYKILVGKPKGKRPLEDRIILKWILNRILNNYSKQCCVRQKP